MGTDKGVKLDTGKGRAWQCLLAYFPRALQGVCKVSDFGAEKYCVNGWSSVEDGHIRYSDALVRHLLEEQVSPYDNDSGLHHDLHIAWNALARAELRLRKARSPDETL